MMNKLLIIGIAGLLYGCGPQSFNDAEFPQPIKLEHVTVSGDLKARAIRNFDRMESSIYHPDNLFITASGDSKWPGDMEGRAALALTMLGQSTHRTPEYLETIIREFPSKMNSLGYFGPIHKDSVSEQQLAGHGWTLRALCEYYNWKKDTSALGMIKKIIEHLALPTKSIQKNYPIDPAKRINSGSYGGTEESKIGNWILSTDIGCNYIFLDGLTQAYQIMPSHELKELIDEMIGRFFEIDLVSIKAQTHASLTAMRAILRYYETIGDHNLLEEVRKRFDLYIHQGITENFENYNWFGRPEWTEPCAVIDSYIDAFYLWRFTDNPDYLNLAHSIYFNGMCFEQRSNGGFGLQNCSGSKDNLLFPLVEEAYWCCSMRGGEGLSRAIQNLFYLKGKAIIVPSFANAEVTLSAGKKFMKVKETTVFPYNYDICFTIVENNLSFAPEFRLFIPSYAELPEIFINNKKIAFKKENGFAIFSEPLTKGDAIKYSFKTSVRAEDTKNSNTVPGYFTFHYGPLLLGSKDSSKFTFDKNVSFNETRMLVFKPKGFNVELTPVMHLMDSSVIPHKGYYRQILFKEKVPVTYANHQVLLIDKMLIYNDDGFLTDFLPRDEFLNWLTPINYEKGTVYSRVEVFFKPDSSTETSILLRLGSGEHHERKKVNIYRYAKAFFTKPGITYCTEPVTSAHPLVSPSEFRWNGSITFIQLPCADKFGKPVSRWEQDLGAFYGKKESYFPLKVRFSAIIVPEGQTLIKPDFW